MLSQELPSSAPSLAAFGGEEIELLLTELGGLVLGREAKQAPWDLCLHCSEKQQNLLVVLPA